MCLSGLSHFMRLRGLRPDSIFIEAYRISVTFSYFDLIVHTIKPVQISMRGWYSNKFTLIC